MLFKLTSGMLAGKSGQPPIMHETPSHDRGDGREGGQSSAWGKLVPALARRHQQAKFGSVLSP
jgi:hypothetical protein